MTKRSNNLAHNLQPKIDSDPFDGLADFEIDEFAVLRFQFRRLWNVIEATCFHPWMYPLARWLERVLPRWMYTW